MHPLGLIGNEITEGWWIAAIGAPSANRAWAIALGIVFAIIAVSLLVASWTRWGQTKPLAKCVGLAVLAHIWLLMYAYGTRIASPGIGPGSDGGVSRLSDPPATFAWEGASAELSANANGPGDSDLPSVDGTSVSEDSPVPVAQPWETALTRPVYEQKDAPKLPLESSESNDRVGWERNQPDHLMDVPDVRSDNDLLSMAELPIDPGLPSLAREASPTAFAAATPTRRNETLVNVPPAYRMRMAPDRMRFAAALGGDANTETAVQNGLSWLARAQSPEGAWNAQQHGAGGEPRGAAVQAEGQYRASAGRRADTAMTGLALLAFLGAGHTHREGPYAGTVQRGIQYLLGQQFPSGDLSGRNQVGQDPTVRYARMYSHGMAALAISELYAMTQDADLLPALQAAAGYTLHAMNPRTGGWRYDFASDDPGDTSQFGWQAMFLHSASKSGAVVLSGGTRLGLQRFLDSVSTGPHGGLAVYRNVHEGTRASATAATPAMTAEAMAMRCMLELPIGSSAARESQEMILSHLPGLSQENLYYWYYGAMAMFQLRSRDQAFAQTDPASPNETAWRRWNDAMKRQLCGSQLVQGPDAGSWNPTCVWGSYGGRVYSTAMACMCLEVYYRYLPLYHEFAQTP